MKTYTGGCHCGKVRYEVGLDLTGGISCNCSICSKRGWILTFAPIDSFKLLSGEDEVTDYQFNKHVIHHLFCTTCGTASYSIGQDPEGNKVAAINIRCLDDVDLESITVTPYDGKNA